MNKSQKKYADIGTEATVEKDLHVPGLMKKVTVILVTMKDSVETKCASRGAEDCVITGPRLQ